MSDDIFGKYQFKKGVFKAPFTVLKEMVNFSFGNWNYERLPSFLWLALIVKKYGHNNGLEICGKIIKFINEQLNTHSIIFLDILELEDEKQEELFEYIKTLVDAEVLYPLTLIFTYSNYPIFAKHFFVKNNFINRKNIILEIIRDTYDHQSEISTDLRFLIIWNAVFAKKISFAKGDPLIESLLNYHKTPHSEDIMKLWRPSIRTTESAISSQVKFDVNFNNMFWGEISEMTKCELYIVDRSKEIDLGEAKQFIEKLKNIAKYYNDMFINFYPLDKKMEVLISIYCYSYKRIIELVEHNLFNEISGRGIIRNIIENYIMMKYLVKEESNHLNIWNDFISYGFGQMNLILTKYKDTNRNVPRNSHFDVNYINTIISSETDSRFLDLDTRYFDKINIRIKADIVGEKDLYDFYYDYDSQYEHGLWGAIRESVSLICNNPAHKYHHGIDYEDKQKLPNVWNDCKDIMNKTLKFLNTIYPIPEKLL
ncbi:MAG: DUF5677 domain-containing protein [Acholeplasmataceae bacterium]